MFLSYLRLLGVVCRLGEEILREPRTVSTLLSLNELCSFFFLTFDN